MPSHKLKVFFKCRGKGWGGVVVPWFSLVACVCLCVCVNHLSAKVSLVTYAGGQRPSSKRCLTKLCLKVDAQSDLRVPAKQNGRHGHLIVQLVANICGRFYMSGRHSHVHTCQCIAVADMSNMSFAVLQLCGAKSFSSFSSNYGKR